ncbi:hypothetical protein HYDPIDRAFT_189685 [Hydnomerulius pinastri MD-312]|uniref:Uncharacterized protein n=1 Tax=Hydnomerulius pinastri MD-312 TaxID=994086 RepID=A0A0C9WC00_9AGAM|nr:hypothetical protein HYDPIDRAFT_189685 [Hydnomerulius pinastri MD-312]
MSGTAYFTMAILQVERWLLRVFLRIEEKKLITECRFWMLGNSQSDYDMARGDKGNEWTSFNEGLYFEEVGMLWHVPPTSASAIQSTCVEAQQKLNRKGVPVACDKLPPTISCITSCITSFAERATVLSDTWVRAPRHGQRKYLYGTSNGIRQWLGIQRNFTIDQQGITAEIVCQTQYSSSYELNFTNTNIAVPVPESGSASTAYTLIAWNSTANCNTSVYLTLPAATCLTSFRNKGSVAAQCGGNWLPPLVIATQGFYKYDFLPPTICEVTPLITTIRVDYTDGGIINASEIVSNRTFTADESDLLFYLAGVANYYARHAQGLLNNITGDTVFSIYSGEINTPISSGTDEVYSTLEDYWRGVVKFSATFLQAGYSAEGAFQAGIPSNMTAPLNGTMYIMTMGWANRGPIYIFSILPLGIGTVLIVLTAVHSLVQSWKERDNEDKQTSFDVSDTLLLIIASAGGNLTSKLSGFDNVGLLESERGHQSTAS